MLMWGVERRSGPLWIAIGASLKAVPLLLAIVYAGRGEWRRAGLAVLLSAVLIAPMLLFELSGYSTAPGGAQLSLTSVAAQLYLAAAIVMAGVAYLRARCSHGWLVGVVAMIVALPRFLTYEVSFLLVGLARRPATTPDRRGPQPAAAAPDTR